MNETKYDMLHVRLASESIAALKLEAEGRGCTTTDLVRDIIAQHQAARAVHQAAPILTAELESTLERVFGRHVNRLAALSSRAVIEASWSKWLAVAIIERSADRAKGTVPMYDDVDSLLEETHQAAVRDCQRRAHPWDKPATEAAPDEASAPDAP